MIKKTKFDKKTVYYQGLIADRQDSQEYLLSCVETPGINFWKATAEVQPLAVAAWSTNMKERPWRISKTPNQGHQTPILLARVESLITEGASTAATWGTMPPTPLTIRERSVQEQRSHREQGNSFLQSQKCWTILPTAKVWSPKA